MLPSDRMSLRMVDEWPTKGPKLRAEVSAIIEATKCGGKVCDTLAGENEEQWKKEAEKYVRQLRKSGCGPYTTTRRGNLFYIRQKDAPVAAPVVNPVDAHVPLCEDCGGKITDTARQVLSRQSRQCPE